jgi:hypothetical protein
MASSIGGDYSPQVGSTGWAHRQNEVASTNRPIGLGTLKGKMMPKARITSEQKEEIRTLYASGAFTQVMLADKFGLRQGTISAIVKKSR